MGRLEESGWPWHGPSSGQSFEAIEEVRSRAQHVYNLPGIERQAVMLLVEHRTIGRVSEFMRLPKAEVRRIIVSAMKRLGVKRHYELFSMVRMTQMTWEVTPALALYLFAQHNLVGAVIRGAVVQDSDWAGLLLDMPDGTTKTAWLLDSRDGDTSGCWIQLEED